MKKIILLIIFILFFGCSTEPMTAEEYLVANTHTIVEIKEDDCYDFDFDKDIDVVLTGETHGTVVNYVLQLEMIKYLSEKHNKVTILAETGYGSGRLYNRYINSGNIKILDMVFDTLENTPSYSNEAYEFWQALCDYNSTLDPDHKLEVYGLDIEFGVTAGLIHLYLLDYDQTVARENNEAFEAFTSSYNDIKSIDHLNTLIERLKVAIDEDELFFKRLYGEDYFDFKMTVNNMYKTNIAKQMSKLYRDDIMYDTFKILYEEFDTGIYYGQFGSEHIVKEVHTSFMGEEERFAMKLDLGGYKVLSIMYLYKDSRRMVNNGQGSYKIYQDVFHTERLSKLGEKDMLMVKLDGEHSPFKKELDFFGAFNRQAVTTDFVEYFIVVNGSEATQMKKAK